MSAEPAARYVVELTCVSEETFDECVRVSLALQAAFEALDTARRSFMQLVDNGLRLTALPIDAPAQLATDENARARLAAHVEHLSTEDITALANIAERILVQSVEDNAEKEPA